MEISSKSITLFIAILLIGLSSGLLTAWSISVIPGTRKVSDITYLETMQSINKAILNPLFFIVFFVSLLFSIASTVQLHSSGWRFWILGSASLIYAFGTIGITGLGNVPLNNQLDVLNISSLSLEEAKSFRLLYESKWNRLHTYRTIFSLISFILMIASSLFHSKN